VKYWVHERYNEKRFAILHKSTCKFCSDEKILLQNSKNNVNDRWHGGFDSLKDALDFAASIENCQIYQCKVCNPIDQAQGSYDDIGLALHDTKTLTIVENGTSKVVSNIPDMDFFKEIKSKFPNAYLDGAKLVLPGITLNDLQERFPTLTESMLRSRFSGVAFNAPKIDFRTIKQAFPSAYLDDDRLILPETDFDKLKSRFPELTQDALKAKFPSVVYNAPRVDFNTLKSKFPNIYMNGARLVLPNTTFADLKSKFPYITMDALKERFKEISFNASDIDYKTLKEKFPNIYLKEGTLYLPNLTFSDLKQKFPDLTMEALRDRFPNIVFGEEKKKKKSGIWGLILGILALLILIALLIWLTRFSSCNLFNTANSNGTTTTTTNKTASATTTSKPNSAVAVPTFDQIKAKFPDATNANGTLTLPSASFDDLKAQFPDLTLDALKSKFPKVVFGKDSPNNTTAANTTAAPNTTAATTTTTTTTTTQNTTAAPNTTQANTGAPTFDQIKAAFPDATLTTTTKLTLPTASFEDLKAKFPGLTMDQLLAAFPNVEFGKSSTGTFSAGSFTTTANLNFRTAPDMNNTPITVIPRGTSVQAIGQEGDWVQVAYNGTIGYCNINYLTQNGMWVGTAVNKPAAGETETTGNITASDNNSVTINGENIPINSGAKIQMYSNGTVGNTSAGNLAGANGVVVKDASGKTSNILIVK